LEVCKETYIEKTFIETYSCLKSSLFIALVVFLYEIPMGSKRITYLPPIELTVFLPVKIFLAKQRNVFLPCPIVTFLM